MELDRVVKNKKHQPPHHLGQVAVVDVHGVQKKPAKTLTFSAEMCTSCHMPTLWVQLSQQKFPRGNSNRGELTKNGWSEKTVHTTQQKHNSF